MLPMRRIKDNYNFRTGQFNEDILWVAMNICTSEPGRFSMQNTFTFARLGSWPHFDFPFNCPLSALFFCWCLFQVGHMEA